MYVAPEVVRADRYGESADVFSFALVLLELVSGVSTEDRFKQMDIEMKGISGYHEAGKRADLNFVERSPETAMALELIKDCWNGDPLERPKMIEVVDALTGSGEMKRRSYYDEQDKQSPAYAAIEEKNTDDDDQNDHHKDDDENNLANLRKTHQDLSNKHEGLKTKIVGLESRVEELEKLNEGLRKRHGRTAK